MWRWMARDEGAGRRAESRLGPRRPLLWQGHRAQPAFRKRVRKELGPWEEVSGALGGSREEPGQCGAGAADQRPRT